jgi:hypothetical protein
MMLRQAQYCDLRSSASIVFHLQSTLLPLALTQAVMLEGTKLSVMGAAVMRLSVGNDAS